MSLLPCRLDKQERSASLRNLFVMDVRLFSIVGSKTNLSGCFFSKSA